MERKIGEVFELEGRKLKVEKTEYGECDGCYFFERECLQEIHGECCDGVREDNTDVIFKDITDIEYGTEDRRNF